MKQPELGQKILELRKQKGFTQEELVEQCNINVRTIQRIEAGDVAPRSYTIKAILEVLGFDYSEIFDKKYIPGKFDTILGIDKNNIYKQLNIAMIFGIVYFIVGFFEVGAEFLSFEKESSIFKSIYIAIKTLSIISLFLFFRGFVIIGAMFKNYLLQISAFLIIVFVFFFSVLDVTSLYVWEEFLGVFGMAKLIAYGVLSILLGIAIRRLVDFGDLAKWTGILEIITGICLLAVILSPIGVVTQFIVEIFEIILIYRVGLVLKESV
ncbi:helix-turn-helix transcriptional regulator [uncultured Polaribacter sp.]|uniref:helix-turn-helix domain-containing protein n=1 Tax=uncultured Polaribacter sp. TaxID=174711 RepID=UPI0026338955|nr:helix-turn-helix transcriptional regulator [uncultured Polaribacter sp.]